MTLGVLKIVFLPFSTEPSVYNEGVSSILFQIKMTKYNHFFNNYIYKDKTHCYSNIILKCQILQRFCVTTVVIGFIMLKRQKQYNLPLRPLPKMWPWTLAIHNIVKKYHLFHSFIQMITEWPLSSFLVLVFCRQPSCCVRPPTGDFDWNCWFAGLNPDTDRMFV